MNVLIGQAIGGFRALLAGRTRSGPSTRLSLAVGSRVNEVQTPIVSAAPRPQRFKRSRTRWRSRINLRRSGPTPPGGTHVMSRDIVHTCRRSVDRTT